MVERIELTDIRDFYVAVAEHTCEGERRITPKDEQGTTVHNTFLGFECSCGAHFVLPLHYAKCAKVPLRSYFRTPADRDVTAQRLTTDPKGLLSELRNSGGWAQPDSGVALMTLLAAAMGPPGNPMEQELKKMMSGGEKPS